MTAPVYFLFIMDPYETLNLETETSLLLSAPQINVPANRCEQLASE